MTQNRANGDGAPMIALPTDAEILQKWYEYAAGQPGSIGSLLQLLRFRQRKSEEQQRIEFEVSARHVQRRDEPVISYTDQVRAGQLRSGQV